MTFRRFLLPASLALFVGSTVFTAVAQNEGIESGAAVSNDYSTLLTPSANFIAAYWGLIITLLIAQIVYLYRNADSAIQVRHFSIPTTQS